MRVAGGDGTIVAAVARMREMPHAGPVGGEPTEAARPRGTGYHVIVVVKVSRPPVLVPGWASGMATSEVETNRPFRSSVDADDPSEESPVSQGHPPWPVYLH